MTDGHKHRIVRTKRNSPLARLLLKPIYHTHDLRRVSQSPYPYAPCPDKWHISACWYLSGLSILHRWFGLTLEVPDE